MRITSSVVVLGILTALARSVSADYLEVDRKSPIRRQPSSDAPRVVDAQDGDYLVLLDDGRQQGGYYHVKAASKTGWIYRTFVRRFEGDIPTRPRTEARRARGGTGAGVSSAGGAFEIACQVPFGDLATPDLEIDAVCPAEGQGSEGSQAQNRMKNNYCATGPPNTLSFKQFAELQKESDKLNFPHGSKLQNDRTRLRKITSLNNREVGEGSMVRVAGFVMKAHHSNVGKGETVNCKLRGKENNDVHIVLMESNTDEDECKSLTVELSPHMRPWFWDPQYLTGLGRPVRFTGSLLYDAAHKPCTEGHRSNPKRKASWEVHPAYAIDVCEKKLLPDCKPTDDSVWTPLHDYHNLEEDHADEDAEPES